MKNNIEVIYDTKPNEGCGCNCGCAGKTVIEDVQELVENLKNYNFSKELHIDLLPITELEEKNLITKMNEILSNTNATFRIDENNKDEILSDLLPIVTLDGAIVTAYGVPTLNEVVMGIQRHL